jgi:hypothetical protein
LFIIACYEREPAIENWSSAEMWLGGLSEGAIRNWLRLRPQRGASVPFQTPALRMARVCEDERDGMIAILRDFANNGTSYVVPWKSLPALVKLTTEDAALHRAVAETKAATPAAIRAVVSELALSGALGAEAKAREAARLRTKAAYVGNVEAILILHLLNSAGADLTNLIIDPDRRQAPETRSAIAAAAKLIGVRRDEIYERTSEFAKVIQPVGFSVTAGPVSPGWLRVLHEELVAFGRDAASTAMTAPDDVAKALRLVVEAANGTAEISGAVIGMIDYAILDIAATIRRSQTELPVLRQVIDRLSWTLDEWPDLMKTIHDIMRGDPAKIADGLHMMHSMLPSPAVAHVLGQQVAPDGADDIGRAVLAGKLSSIWSVIGER